MAVIRKQSPSTNRVIIVEDFNNTRDKMIIIPVQTWLQKLIGRATEPIIAVDEYYLRNTRAWVSEISLLTPIHVLIDGVEKVVYDLEEVFQIESRIKPRPVVNGYC